MLVARGEPSSYPGDNPTSARPVIDPPLKSYQQVADVFRWPCETLERQRLEITTRISPVQPWADPDWGHGGTGGTCPLQSNGRQKWSDQVGFVSLAGQIPKCTKTCIKSHKIPYMYYVMPKYHQRLGLPDPFGEAYDTPPSPQSVGEEINPSPDLSLTPSASRFVVFGDSSPMCHSQNNFLDPPLRVAVFELVRPFDHRMMP